MRAATWADPDLDVLAFAPSNAPLDRSAAQRLKADFLLHWGIRVRSVRVAASAPVKDRFDSLWFGYIKPMIGIQFQPAFARLAGDCQKDSLRDAVYQTKPARVIMHRLNTMSAIAEDVKMPPFALDLDDIEHKAWKRQIGQPPYWRAKAIFHGWIPALRRGERRAVEASQMAFVCSEADKQELAALWQVERIHVVPNALPVPTGEMTLSKDGVVLFLGMHSYPPNRVAAEYLIEKIWPLIRVRVPSARLVIAGRHSELIRGFSAAPTGVHFKGYVADLEALYRDTKVVCCSILSGGGTRIKIIEAALRAKPIVSTTIGAEGLDFSPDRNEIVLADEAGEFADAVVRLLSDQTAAVQMGKQAQERALAKYSEDVVVSQLGALLATMGAPLDAPA